MSQNIEEIKKKVEDGSIVLKKVEQEIERIIVGQKYMITRMLVGLFSDGHILIEGVPGLAKTLAIKTLASLIKADFKRIQFTPDLLPADILGTMIFQPSTGNFVVRKGPLFTNILLADEINRAPAKVQSALLEVMQEKQISILDNTYPVQEPFLVLATQNPIEQEGTYPLPEAQVDRFMLKLKIDYPSKDEEKIILKRVSDGLPSPQAVIDKEDIIKMREIVKSIYIDEKVIDYIVNIVQATRKPSEFGMKEMSGYIQYGASPRVTIFLTAGAKALSFIRGKAFVTPQDVKDIAHDVLRHRIIITYEAEAEGVNSDSIINTLLTRIEVP